MQEKYLQVVNVELLISGYSNKRKYFQSFSTSRLIFYSYEQPIGVGSADLKRTMVPFLFLFRETD